MTYTMDAINEEMIQILRSLESTVKEIYQSQLNYCLTFSILIGANTHVL